MLNRYLDISAEVKEVLDQGKPVLSVLFICTVDEFL